MTTASAATKRVLLRVEEAGEALGVSRSVIYELIASGRLESVHIGRSRRVPLMAVHDFVGRLRADQGHDHA